MSMCCITQTSPLPTRSARPPASPFDQLHLLASRVRHQAPGLQLQDQALLLTQASYGRTFAGDFVGGEATARRALAVAERAGSTAMTVWSLSAMSPAVKTQGR